MNFVKRSILGLQLQQTPPPTHEENYAQNLLSRFNLPSARQGLAAPAGDFYGLLGAALGQVGLNSGSRDVKIKEMSRDGTLIPQEFSNNDEKLSFLSTQREKLRMLLTALDIEASELSKEEIIQRDVERRLGEGIRDEGLKKSRSEAEFDTIDDQEELKNVKVGSAAGGGWMPWNWGAQDSTGRTKEKST